MGWLNKADGFAGVGSAVEVERRLSFAPYPAKRCSHLPWKDWNYQWGRGLESANYQATYEVMGNQGMGKVRQLENAQDFLGVDFEIMKDGFHPGLLVHH